MKYYSTRRQSPEVNLKEAVFRGLPPDNGLYMPEQIPVLPDSFFRELENKSLTDIAFEVTKAFTQNEIPDAELRAMLDERMNFDAPVVHVHDNIHVLELWHGPSNAFKDFGARFMSGLMGWYLKQKNEEINILVATSGDTGSAVAQGFYDMPGISVTILYPSGKVSEIQEKQLTTLGGNITALEIDGNFDDCQRLVKQAFLDTELAGKLNLSSANSINLARLIPQSFYYFYAAAQLKKKGLPLVVSVPSGNFGNLCGGLIARAMGLPIHHFVASVNANRVVADYLATGKFEAGASVQTISNAMDVGNPSNFYRITEFFGNDWEKVKHDITGYSFNDDETRSAIRSVFEQTGYICCPHSAVGYLGLKKYLDSQKQPLTGVFLSTAHPAKFLDVIEEDIAAKVIMPASLTEVMKKEKKSIRMKADFEELKGYLLR